MLGDNQQLKKWRLLSRLSVCSFILVVPLILTAAWVVFDIIDPFGLKLSATRAAVGINPQLNYQGKIADSAGTALTDGNYNFIFELYDSLGSGAMLWSETWSSTSTAGQVTVNEGIFSVTLGTSSTLTASIFNSDNLYLQIRFDDDADGNFDEVFSPRKRLTASPYSFNSDMVDGIHATTTATANQLLALDSSAGMTLNSVTTSDSLYVTGPATFAGIISGVGFSSAWDSAFNSTSSWKYFSYNFDNLLIATTTWAGNLTVSDELFAPAARLTVLNATTTNIDNLTVYSSVSLPNNAITDLMVADNITASNYLSLANWFSTTTHANIASLPSLSITESQISDLSHYTNADTGDYLDASTTIQTYFSNAATAFSWGNHATAGYLSYPVASSTYLALTDWYATTTWSGNLTVNGELFNSNDSRLSNLNASTTRVDNLIAYDGITLGGVYRNTWPAAS
ncbi:MAG TPA: hypothetical protein PK896_03225, partial [bacterium]|nr:hypothetical protein [bacterium]